jgi:acetyl-CoA C-acetyltransferase
MFQRRHVLTIKNKAYIAGIYEHPTRHAPDKSTAQLHAEVAKGALDDAGLTKADIDGYFCAGDAPGGIWQMSDYLGLNNLRHLDSTRPAAAPTSSRWGTLRRPSPRASVPSR